MNHKEQAEFMATKDPDSDAMGITSTSLARRFRRIASNIESTAKVWAGSQDEFEVWALAFARDGASNIAYAAKQLLAD